MADDLSLWKLKIVKKDGAEGTVHMDSPEEKAKPMPGPLIESEVMSM